MTVHLFLPHYDETAVRNVISDLQNVEDVPPTQVGVSREMVTLHKRPNSEDIFAAMQKLVTYRVNAVRQQSSLRRLVALGRSLTMDRLDEDAQAHITNQIVNQIGAEIRQVQEANGYDERAKQITEVALKTIALKDAIITDDKLSYTIDAASADIDRHFERAGRVLSNGLHMAYWKQQSSRDYNEVKIEVIILAQSHEAMARLEAFASRSLMPFTRSTSGKLLS